ncbi:LysM peptidoglycan-binding domain-containing protein [Kitasatospora sp. NBC_01539]|uniref:LysM peptidoglycan-binding domain-containing protein n=1 Tax=Kitasatospora sp. NBC_01539 TaxID=2903577 RepID=UPI0038603261
MPAPRPAQQPATRKPAASQSATGQSAATDEPDPTISTRPGPGPAKDGTILVQDGDTLGGIAQAQQVVGGWPAGPLARWPALYEANHGAIGDNPDLILPAQTLRLP